MACRFVALNKNPGVRQIGIGERPRWIIAIATFEQDAGTAQFAGQISEGVEAATCSRLLYMLSIPE